MKNNLIITPKQFRDAADSVLRDKTLQSRLENVWGSPAADYTEVWEGRKKKDGFYDRLARALNFQCQQQYWDIDAVYYKNRAMNAGRGYRVEFISLAFEHENNANRSGIAWNRLLAANASLKVLATYIHFADAEDYLANYAEQTRVVDDVLPGFSEQQKHIAMFCDMDSENWDWRYYLYKNGKFELMK